MARDAKAAIIWSHSRRPFLSKVKTFHGVDILLARSQLPPTMETGTALQWPNTPSKLRCKTTQSSGLNRPKSRLGKTARLWRFRITAIVTISPRGKRTSFGSSPANPWSWVAERSKYSVPTYLTQRLSPEKTPLILSRYTFWPEFNLGDWEMTEECEESDLIFRRYHRDANRAA